MNSHHRRRWLCLFAVVTLLSVLICTQAADHTEASERSFYRQSDCFEVFSNKSSAAVSDYATEHENCNSTLLNRQRFLTREKEAERELIEIRTSEICENYRNCKSHKDHKDFFYCHSHVGVDNTDKLSEIHFTASAVVVDLSEQYEEAEKMVVLCRIEARRNYTETMREAFWELKACLEGSP